MNNCHEYYYSAMEVDRLCNLWNLSSRGVEGRVVATSTLMAPEKAEKYEKKAGEFWDKYYSIHQNNFCSQNQFTGVIAEVQTVV